MFRFRRGKEERLVKEIETYLGIEGEGKLDSFIRRDKMEGENKLTFSVQEAGQMLGLCRNSMYQGIAAGEIPCIKIGKRFLIPRDALLKMLGEARLTKKGGDGYI